MALDKHIMPGILYIVATPIGNLGDISQRAIDTLKKVDWIAAEDTRHSASLLKHFNIQQRTLSLHEYNEKKKIDLCLDKLKKGESIALISDAGTPLISDPGYHLVKAARTEGIKVVPIPGACALIAALSICGLPSDRFVFEGFLPAKNISRLKHLETLKSENRTLIFYEAPHRILDTLNDMQTIFGKDRFIVVTRELTKHFESTYEGSIEKILSDLSQKTEECRGEFVLVVSGCTEQEEELSENTLSILKLLLKELPVNQAVKLAAQITGSKKNSLYEEALKEKNK